MILLFEEHGIFKKTFQFKKSFSTTNGKEKAKSSQWLREKTIIANRAKITFDSIHSYLFIYLFSDMKYNLSTEPLNAGK